MNITTCEDCGVELKNDDRIDMIDGTYPRRYRHVECPEPRQCPLCEQVIMAGEDVRDLSNGYAHRECLLRSVLGGIGHMEDHQHWCVEVGDPNGGRTYRQSAIEVDEWVHRHGIEAATGHG